MKTYILGKYAAVDEQIRKRLQRSLPREETAIQSAKGITTSGVAAQASGGMINHF